MTPFHQKRKIIGFKRTYYSQTGVGGDRFDQALRQQTFENRLVTLHLKSRSEDRIELIKTNDEKFYRFSFHGNLLDGLLDGCNSLSYDPTSLEANVEVIIAILDRYYVLDFNALMEIRAFVKESSELINKEIVFKYLELFNWFRISEKNVKEATDFYFVEKIMTD